MLEDAANVVLEFLEVVIHNILYVRNIYPNGIFTIKKKYSVPAHVSLYPDLNSYITESLMAIKKLLILKKIAKLNVCFFNDSAHCIQRFVFDIQKFQECPLNSGIEGCVQSIHEAFRAICLKMSAIELHLKPLPKNSTFQIQAETTDLDMRLISEDPALESFPWISAESNEVALTNSHILPIRTIQTDFLEMQIYAEESADK